MIAQRKWIPAQEETLMQQPRPRRVLLPSMQTPRPLLAGTLAGRGKPGEGPQHALGVMPECHQGLTTTPSHPSCSGKAAATRPALLQQCCYDGLRARGTWQSQPPWRRKCSFFCRNSKYLAPRRLLLSLRFGRWRHLPFTFLLFRQLCFLLFLFLQVFLDVFWKLPLPLRVFVLEGDQNATAGSIRLPCRGLSCFPSYPPFCPFSSAFPSPLVCSQVPARSTREPVWNDQGAKRPPG